MLAAARARLRVRSSGKYTIHNSTRTIFLPAVADESSGGGGDDVPAGGDGQAPFGLCYFISISLDCFCYSSLHRKSRASTTYTTGIFCFFSRCNLTCTTWHHKPKAKEQQLKIRTKHGEGLHP